MTQMRLDRFLSEMGVGTRSEIKIYVKKKKIKVNGDIVKSSDIKIDTLTDEVSYDDNVIEYKEYEYYMLYKPAGVVTATRDNNCSTVLDLIKNRKRKDLSPVGRLDKDTEGLLLITNDGMLSHNLLAPGKHVDKEYYVELDKPVSEEDIRRIESGIDIGDDTPTKPSTITICNDYSHLKIIITEGRYHQIKRMFEAVSCTVTYLKRLRMGSLVLDEGLLPGEYRALTDKEIKSL